MLPVETPSWLTAAFKERAREVTRYFGVDDAMKKTVEEALSELPVFVEKKKETSMVKCKIAHVAVRTSFFVLFFVPPLPPPSLSLLLFLHFVNSRGTADEINPLFNCRSRQVVNRRRVTA